jgi:hypothetical protein
MHSSQDPPKCLLWMNRTWPCLLYQSCTIALMS